MVVTQTCKKVKCLW